MGTLVAFHAHPDDEAIATGGSMARAANDGHRVVLIVATGGEHGEVPPDLGPDESLADRRRAETEASAAALGIHRVAWLGFSDSGMNGWDQNDHHEAFWQADIDHAAELVAAILREEQAEVFVHYDWHGNYGHPDHVQVHRVGTRAHELVAEELPLLRVFHATMNRDAIRRQVAEARAAGLAFAEDDFDPDAPMDDGHPMGTPESELTMVVDVLAFIDHKRAAIAAHTSQISDSSFFLQMPPEAFAASFGQEWFVEQGRDPGMQPGWLFDHL